MACAGKLGGLRLEGLCDDDADGIWKMVAGTLIGIRGDAKSMDATLQLGGRSGFRLKITCVSCCIEPDEWGCYVAARVRRYCHWLVLPPDTPALGFGECEQDAVAQMLDLYWLTAYILCGQR